MAGRDDKCLDGEGLETLWGLVKAHVTSALQGWDGRNTSTEGVHTSSITHVGTIAYGTWHGSAIEAAYIGSTAKGQLLYGNGSNVMALLGIGTAGQFLKVVDGAPAWSDLPVASGESESTLAGIVSTESQSFAGQKTFNSGVNIPKGSVYYHLDSKAVLQLNASNYTVFNYGMRAVSGNRLMLYAQDRFQFYLGDTAYAYITNARLSAYSNDTLFLGNSSTRWKNVFSVLGNFSGLLTASGGIESGGYIDIKNGNTFAGLRHITTSYGSSNIGGVDGSGVYFAHTLTGYTAAEMRLKAGVGLSVNSDIKTTNGGDIIASGGVAAGGIADLTIY